jgi:pyruvate dehydrogenase E2 component (dihydrolipoamide acetyltransferase)
MSAHSASHDHSADDHAAGDHEDHDDHDDHDVEAIPPEPESPAWLPLLGAALFLLALLGFLLANTEETEPASAAATAEAAAAPAPTPEPAAAPAAAAASPRPRPMIPRMPRPDGNTAANGAPGRANPPTFPGGARPAPGHEGHGHP